MSEKEKTTVKCDRLELFTLLQNFSNLRTGQDQVLWSVFGAFWATNALLLISIFSSNNNWTVSQVGIVASIIGWIISSFWIIIQLRTLARIKMYENSIQKIEKELSLQESFYAFSKTPKPLIDLKIKARDVMNINCWAIWVGWIISFIFFIRE